MEIDEAIMWADTKLRLNEQYCGLSDTAAMKSLASEVRRLRDEVAGRNQRALDGDRALIAMNGVLDLLDKTENELGRLRSQRCETCGHTKHAGYGSYVCTKVGNLDGTTYAQCSDLGGGCLAWEKRND